MSAVCMCSALVLITQMHEETVVLMDGADTPPYAHLRRDSLSTLTTARTFSPTSTGCLNCKVCLRYIAPGCGGSRSHPYLALLSNQSLWWAAPVGRRYSQPDRLPQVCPTLPPPESLDQYQPIVYWRRVETGSRACSRAEWLCAHTWRFPMMAGNRPAYNMPCTTQAGRLLVAFAASCSNAQQILAG